MVNYFLSRFGLRLPQLVESTQFSGSLGPQLLHALHFDLARRDPGLRLPLHSNALPTGDLHLWCMYILRAVLLPAQTASRAHDLRLQIRN